MLIQFSVGNYLSFKEIVTLNLVAANINELEESNIFRINKEISVVKSAGIYGANASGKTNLFRAIQFMRSFVVNSSKESQAKEKIDTIPFRLNTESMRSPSFFEVLFVIEDQKYRYGFEISQEKVFKEWLFFTKIAKENVLFEREGDRINLDSRFKEGNGLQQKTRNNALFLSVVAQFNGEISQKILHWFQNLNVISGLRDESYRGVGINLLKTSQDADFSLASKAFSKMISEADLSIEDFKVSEFEIDASTLPREMPIEVKREFLKTLKGKKSLKILTGHKKYDAENKLNGIEYFDFEEDESEGTKQYFRFAGPIIDTLHYGKVLFIDELDAKLHTILTSTIVKLFNNKETNPKNAQLVFTTHDTNLLACKILRRDQIWFTEKDNFASTDLYSLVEYKIEKEGSESVKVRNDASFEKDYIRGRYGAIPFIGDFSKLWESKDV